MDGNNHILSFGASTLIQTNKNDLGIMFPGIPTMDDTEADVLNDETFGDCDLETIKIKSDFGENGEFLGDNPSEELPDFFNTDLPSDDSFLIDNNDQSQQPSIDALLGEDPMRMSTASMNLRQSTINPLFNMAISQAREPNHGNIFPQQQQQQQQQQIPRMSPMTLSSQQQQQHMNYQLLKQFEQLLISRQIPPEERIVYMRAMIDKMQRDAFNMQQQTARISNLNLNGHNPLLQQEAPSMPIGEMMERARLTAMNTNDSRSQSPRMSSQFMDAIQRSDQIPIVDNQSLSSPRPSNHHQHHHNNNNNQSRHNRPARHYPRPPLLNTWQGRGPQRHDEFAGLMSDREKQWVVKIQLHQVSQTQEEDFYFHKWSQRKQQGHENQSNRYDHRTQKISYPVLQLLKSIQQEKELAERLSQSSTQAIFSNVNPSQALPYAVPLHTQLGKQSTASPRHPRCTLHLDGQFSLGTRANAITYNKYNLGLLLNIENILRDISQLDNNNIESIIDRYINNLNYFFPDMFGQFNKGQIILERLYSYLITSTTGQLELILTRLYASLSYMICRWETTFHIEPIVMNTINLMQQHVNIKKTTFEQLLGQVYIYYNEQIKSKLTEFDSAASSSPFSSPTLFTNSQVVTILIDLLLTLERQCYLLSTTNSTTLPIQVMQQLQPQLQYQLSEYVRLFVNDLCQALIACSSVQKILKPFAQIQQQQFGLLCKFIRIQISQETYAAVEPKLIHCCIKNA